MMWPCVKATSLSDRREDRTWGLGVEGVMLKDTSEFKTVRYEKGEPATRTDMVPRESSIDICLCGTRLVTLQASPNQLVELAVGFLLSEGLIETSSEFETASVDAGNKEVRVEAKDRKKVLSRLLDRGDVIRTSGCSRGTSFGGYDTIQKVESELSVSSGKIKSMTKKMLKAADLHNTCGGVHCSALVRGSRVITLSEDIGRHNTIDKIVGQCFLTGVDTSDTFLLTTGRISSEMVAKCARSGIPVVVSMTSPTDLAIQIADKLGVTVVGYVRASRMTVYTHGERIGK